MTLNIELNTQNISRDDIKECVKIHRKEIKGGLLNTFGDKFLIKIYNYILINDSSFLIVAKKDGVVIGFFAGCINQSNFFLNFIFKNFFFMIPYIWKIVKQNLYNKILKIKNFFLSNKYLLPNASILNFCVKNDFQSMGIGKLLFNKAIETFKKNNIKSIKISTGKNQEKAKKMYLSYGAKLINNNLNSNNNNLEVIFILNI